jgi:hypothetical protein
MGVPDISNAAYHCHFKKSTSNSLSISDSLSWAAAPQTVVCLADAGGNREYGRQLENL